MDTPLVILANSHKHGGICLAGKVFTRSTKQWVRPVSACESGALRPGWLHHVAGTIPQIGMCLSIPLGKPFPENHQRENHTIESGHWTRIGQLNADDLTTLTDHEEQLWHNDWHSLRGHNDRIPELIAKNCCTGSLRLIKPVNLRFRLDHQPQRTALRALFNYAGHHYVLAVTDDAATGRWRERLEQGHDGHAEGLLTISLGLPLDGYCYKLVAGVIELDTDH